MDPSIVSNDDNTIKEEDHEEDDSKAAEEEEEEEEEEEGEEEKEEETEDQEMSSVDSSEWCKRCGGATPYGVDCEDCAAYYLELIEGEESSDDSDYYEEPKA